MKVGILTLPLQVNYGGILQAYALQSILESMGHEVRVINKSPYIKKAPIPLQMMRYIKRFLKKLLRKDSMNIFFENVYNASCDSLVPFVKKNIKCEFVEKLSDISESTFDAIVIGSDQIWRPKYASLAWGDIRNAFASFTKKWNILKVAYAVSFGVDDWEYSEAETEDCRSMLKSFSAVSCRESSGLELCSKFLDYPNVKLTLDPTLLLSVEDYYKFIDTTRNPSSKMLCYLLDENDLATQIIGMVKSIKKLEEFRIGDLAGQKAQKPSVEMWLQSFYDAEFIITDSFHACVFSILFKKPFLVVGNKERGVSRIESLLKTFKLEKCLITSDIDAQSFCWNADNQCQTQEILAKKKQESMIFLRNAFAGSK